MGSTRDTHSIIWHIPTGMGKSYLSLNLDLTLNHLDRRLDPSGPRSESSDMVMGRAVPIRRIRSRASRDYSTDYLAGGDTFFHFCSVLHNTCITLIFCVVVLLWSETLSWPVNVWYNFNQNGNIVNLIKNANLMLKPSTCITTNIRCCLIEERKRAKLWLHKLTFIWLLKKRVPLTRTPGGLTKNMLEPKNS